MKQSDNRNYVAVWVGSFKNNEDFEEYIKIDYDNEMSNDIDSQFEKDYELDYYDRALVESTILPNELNTLQELFLGSSYLDGYVASLDTDNKKALNVIIRVYDYKYEKDVSVSKFGDNSLEFYGNIEYEKVVDLSWMGL